MSLDVSLYRPNTKKVAGSGIFVRTNGATKEITRDEWNELYPDREPIVVTSDEEETTDWIYTANITHNLNTMADKAGVYQACWRPEEIGATKAHELIPILAKGYIYLLEHETKLLPLNPANGWGNYGVLVQFVRNYLLACIDYPDADIHVSR